MKDQVVETKRSRSKELHPYDLAHDLIHMEINDQTTFGEIKSKFLKIMKQHGVDRNVDNFKNGEFSHRTTSSPEWIMSFETMSSTIKSYLTVELLMKNPEKLPNHPDE